MRFHPIFIEKSWFEVWTLKLSWIESLAVLNVRWKWIDIVDVRCMLIPTICSLYIFVPICSWRILEMMNSVMFLIFLEKERVWSYFCLFPFWNLFTAGLDQSRRATSFSETGRFAPGAGYLQLCHPRLINYISSLNNYFIL